MLLLKLSLISSLLLNRIYCDDYVVPEPKFELIKPMGFRVSIPDEMGLQLFAFHGNVNRPMEHLEAGQMSTDIIKKRNGRWIYENNKIKLREGDVIHFWLFVIKHGKGYRYDDGSFYCNNVPEGNGYYKKYGSQGYHHKQRRGTDSDDEDEDQDGNMNMRNRGYFPTHNHNHPFRKPNRFPPYHPQPFEVYGPPRLQPGYGGPHGWGHHRYPYDDPPRHGFKHHHHHHHHHQCDGDGKSNENENSNESGFTDSRENPTTGLPMSTPPSIPTARPTMVPTPVPTSPSAPSTTTGVSSNTQLPFPDIDIRFGGT